MSIFLPVLSSCAVDWTR